MWRYEIPPGWYGGHRSYSSYSGDDWYLIPGELEFKKTLIEQKVRDGPAFDRFDFLGWKPMWVSPLGMRCRVLLSRTKQRKWDCTAMLEVRYGVTIRSEKFVADTIVGALELLDLCFTLPLLQFALREYMRKNRHLIFSEEGELLYGVWYVDHDTVPEGKYLLRKPNGCVSKLEISTFSISTSPCTNRDRVLAQDIDPLEAILLHEKDLSCLVSHLVETMKRIATNFPERKPRK